MDTDECKSTEVLHADTSAKAYLEWVVGPDGLDVELIDDTAFQPLKPGTYALGFSVDDDGSMYDDAEVFVTVFLEVADCGGGGCCDGGPDGRAGTARIGLEDALSARFDLAAR